MKYRCPKCKGIFFRDGRTNPVKGKKSFLSYCSACDVIVRVRRLSQSPKKEG